MASNKHAFSWMDTTNTVFDRMAENSMIHRFTSCRKVRRRTKALNKALGKLPSLVEYTYSQYVKTKTSILRDLSNDSETDNSDTFSDEEYQCLYKSDFLRYQYLNNANAEHMCSTHDSRFVSNKDKYQMTVVKDKGYPTINQCKSNDRNLECTNLSWQNLKRKAYESEDSMRITNTRKPNCQNSRPRVGKATGESIITNDPAELCMRMGKATTSQLKDQSLYVPNNVHPKAESEVNTDIIHHSNEPSTFDPKYGCPHDKSNSTSPIVAPSVLTTIAKTNKSPEHGARRNLHGILENLEPPHKNKEFSNGERVIRNDGERRTFLDSSFLQLANVNPLGRSTPVHETTYRKVFEVYSPSICAQNQPKDSGIDEDSEEESYKDGTKRRSNIKTIARSPQKKHDDPPIDLFSETITKCSQNAVSTRDVFCVQQENETQKHKTHPKVMCTEIVSKKYKIISEEPRDITFSAYGSADTWENSLVNKSVEIVGEDESQAGNPDINNDNEEHLKISEEDKAAEDSMSPMTMKRLRQLRRLNLIVTGNSSSSEDDEPLDQMNVSRESVGNSKYIGSPNDDNDYCSDRPIQVHVETRIKDTPLRMPIDPRHDQPVKIESLVKTTRKKFTVADEDEDRTDTDKSTNGHHGSNVVTVDRTSNHATQSRSKSMIGKRASNLQELMDEEELVEMENAPSFLFNDIDEDDIFIVDMPKAVSDRSKRLLETELRGEKIRLTEKRLKLGRHKYQVVFKDLENVSCVFATGKSRKPYKTVNLKPAGIVIVGPQKSTRDQFSEEDERCASDLSTYSDYPLKGERSVGKSLPLNERVDKGLESNPDEDRV